MDLDVFIESLRVLVARHPPDLGDEDSVLSLLYEAHSESNAMYDDEIKASFHMLYEAMNGIPPAGDGSDSLSSLHPLPEPSEVRIHRRYTHRDPSVHRNQ